MIPTCSWILRIVIWISIMQATECGVKVSLSPSRIAPKSNTPEKSMGCKDAGEYKCIVMFEDENDIPITEEASATLEVDSTDWETFLCYFKCLGGIEAIGLGGVLALIALVHATFPAVGFVPAGPSIAAKLLAWYYGAVATDSIFAILKSIGAAGIGFKTILTSLFGTAAVTAALNGGCPDCRDMC